MTKIYSPEYCIRIFPHLGKQDQWDPIIEPKNVMSINCTKDIYQAAGSFNIEFDYKHGTFDNDDWFFRIEPMDYIEIYMAREFIESYDKNGIRGIRGFGVYEKNGDKYTYKGDFATAATEDIKTEEQKQEEVKQKGKLKTDSILGASPKSKQRPLYIQEKIDNPYFVFCGFIDRVGNRFTMTESGPYNRFTLEGRGVEKILQEHNIFFNVQQQEKYLFKQIESFLSIPTLTPAKGVDFVLTMFFADMLDPQGSLMPVEDGKGKRIWESDFFKFTVNTRKSEDQIERIADLEHKVPPSIRHLSWAKIDEYPWGRMYDDGTGTTRSILNIVEGPIWSILQQIGNKALNELWVDETGNIVMRLARDAWLQPEEGGDLAKDQKPWIYIDDSEIHSWTFTKSDDQLKTIVTVIPVASIMGAPATVAGYYGQAPLTTQSKNFLIDRLKITNPNTGVTAASLTDLQTYVQNNMISHLGSFDLSTDEGVTNFWATFGQRPFEVNDIYHDDPALLLETAATVFTLWANTFWTGNVEVRGDNKYKLGRVVYFNDIGARFYCHGVEHNFVWGEGWKTTLHLTRGEKEGTVLDFNSDLVPSITRTTSAV